MFEKKSLDGANVRDYPPALQTAFGERRSIDSGETAMNRLMWGLLLVICGSSGCASQARFIEQNADSGVVAIPSNTDSWPTYNRRAALALIEKHIGPHYEIVERREVATGTATTNNQNVNNEQTWNSSNPLLPANKQTVTTTTTTRDVTEWRIAYRRKAMPNSTVGANPTPGATPGLTPAGGVAPAGPGAQPAGGIVPSVAPRNAVVPAGGAARNQPTGGYVEASAFIGQMR
jgi:hypothetical protein